MTLHDFHLQVKGERGTLSSTEGIITQTEDPGRTMGLTTPQVYALGFTEITVTGGMAEGISWEIPFRSIPCWFPMHPDSLIVGSCAVQCYLLI